MLDVSFIELLVIFVVALVVFGPDKLPQAVRTGALWFGRFKRSFNKVRTEIEQQINADDIRRELHNEAILAEIEEARKNADKLVQDTQKQITKAQDSVNKAVSAANSPAMAVITSSAEEGVPTYSTEAAPTATETPAADPVTAPESETPTEQPAAELAAPAVEENSVEETPAPKAPVQDIYNSPPTGRVLVQGGKVAPLPPANLSATEDKDS